MKNPHESNNLSDEEAGDHDSDHDNDLTHQQLQTLQSMIPNVMGADKRSILEETHDYLQRIHEETERIEKELAQSSNNPSSSSSVNEDPKITSMEIHELMEGTYVVKIWWRKGCFGVTGHVQRVIEECLDVTMTSILLDDNNNDQMLTTAFVKVKEETKMTEKELHGLLMNVAARFGLL